MVLGTGRGVLVVAGEVLRVVMMVVLMLVVMGVEEGLLLLAVVRVTCRVSKEVAALGLEALLVLVEVSHLLRR